MMTKRIIFVLLLMVFLFSCSHNAKDDREIFDLGQKADFESWIEVGNFIFIYGVETEKESFCIYPTYSGCGSWLGPGSLFGEFSLARKTQEIKHNKVYRIKKTTFPAYVFGIQWTYFNLLEPVAKFKGGSQKFLPETTVKWKDAYFSIEPHSGILRKSYDAINWENVPGFFPWRRKNTGRFDNYFGNLFVSRQGLAYLAKFAGSNSDVVLWVSADGRKWNRLSIPENFKLAGKDMTFGFLKISCAFSYKDRIYVSGTVFSAENGGGTQETLISSDDGMDWASEKGLWLDKVFIFGDSIFAVYGVKYYDTQRGPSARPGKKGIIAISNDFKSYRYIGDIRGEAFYRIGDYIYMRGEKSWASPRMIYRLDPVREEWIECCEER